jgi:hypothetical protein
MILSRREAGLPVSHLGRGPSMQGGRGPRYSSEGEAGTEAPSPMEGRRGPPEGARAPRPAPRKPLISFKGKVLGASFFESGPVHVSNLASWSASRGAGGALQVPFPLAGACSGTRSWSTRSWGQAAAGWGRGRRKRGPRGGGREAWSTPWPGNSKTDWRTSTGGTLVEHPCSARERSSSLVGPHSGAKRR